MGMTKREFIRLLGLGMAGGAFCRKNGIKRGTPSEPKNWAWLSMRVISHNEWQNVFDRLVRNGISGILLSGVSENSISVVDLARSAGLEVQAWIVVLNCRNREIKSKHPEWFTVNRLRQSSLTRPPYVGYYTWLCPTRVDVQNYLSRRIQSLAEIDNLNGIHLDYIRHADVILPVSLQPKYKLVQDREYPQFDFCYCDICRRTFKNQQGLDPLDLPDPSQNQSWLQFRYDGITHLVNQLAVVAKKRSKQLTAAVFPTPEIARRLVRQDWINWNLDAVFPMVYHNFYNCGVDWIETATREGVDSLKGRCPLYSGLYIPNLSAEELSRAVPHALKGGADGVSLFREQAMSTGHWQRLSTSIV